MISEPLLAGIILFGPLFLGVLLLAKSQGGWLGWGSFLTMLFIAAFGRYLVQYAVDCYQFCFSAPVSSTPAASNTLIEQANGTAAAFSRMQDTSAVSETVSIILMVIFQLAFLVLCISIYRKIHKTQLPGPN